MENQAQMKQELEYWEQTDAQQPVSDTQPIPQQNQQLDIQPMFDIQRHVTRKRSNANQHLNTVPRQSVELWQNPTPRQNSIPRQYKEAYPNAPRQNAIPHHSPHIRHNPYAQQTRVRTRIPRVNQNIQQPPYMPKPAQTGQASYAPTRRNNTQQPPYARQNTNAVQTPYVQTPTKQPRNPAIRQTANLPQNANKKPKNPLKKTAPPRGQSSKKARRTAAPVKTKNVLFQLLAIFMILVIPVAVFLWTKITKTSTPVTAQPATGQKVTIQEEIREDTAHHPPIEENFLTISEYNRPGTKLASVKNIFVHYTANPGTTAAQNRSYFENLGETHERSASAHFIIGCEGEVIQCIPLEEEAYAVIGRNNDSISIECCYRSEDGKFTQATYDSLISMLAWLIKEYQLEPTDILRHYDCGGKRCPLYYVDHEDAWMQLLEDVSNYSDIP